MNILAVAQHPGATNSIIPVIKELKSRGDFVVTLAHSNNQAIFKYNNVDFSLDTNNISNLDNFDLVLTGTSQLPGNKISLEHKFIKLAKQKGVCTISIMDPFARHELFLQDSKFMPNTICVFDELKKQVLLDSGFMSNIVVTGNPHLDTLQSYDKQICRKKLNLDADKFIVFYPGTISNDKIKELFGFDDSNFVEIVVDALKDSNSLLMIKSHSRSDPNFIQNSLNKVRDKDQEFVVKQDFDSRVLVASADLVIGPNSLVLLESVMLGVETISISPIKGVYESWLGEKGVIPIAHTSKECKQFIDTVRLNNKSVVNYEKLNKRYDSTKRVLDLMYSQVKEN